MIRSPAVLLASVLLAAATVACGPDYPTARSLPATAAAKPDKPGGGGTNVVGQPLGTTAGSRANALNAAYVVGRDAAGAAAWNASGQAIPLSSSGPAGSSSALGVNAASVIVGVADAAAVIWQPVGPDAWAPAASLPSPPGAWTSMTAHAINDQGRALSPERSGGYHVGLGPIRCAQGDTGGPARMAVATTTTRNNPAPATTMPLPCATRSDS
jgi:hypothetical protein